MQQPPNYDPNQSQYPQQPPYDPGQSGQYPPQQPYPQTSGQYPQAPYQQPYGQVPQQPKKKNRVARGCGITAGVVIVIIIIVVIASASRGSGSANTNTSSSNNSSSSTSSTSPTQAPATAHKVGDAVTLGGWGITVNSVTTSTDDPLSQLKAGDAYLEIIVSLKNNTGSNQTFSSLLSFSLTDSTGQKYDQSLTSGATSPDGNVAAGNPLKGTLAYETPKTVRQFILTFTPDISSTDSATWNLSL